MDLKALSDQELAELRQKLSEDAAFIRGQQRAIAEEFDRRGAAISAKRRWEAMSDPERAALIQVISTEAISSEEDVAGPGVRDDG